MEHPKSKSTELSPPGDGSPCTHEHDHEGLREIRTPSFSYIFYSQRGSENHHPISQFNCTYLRDKSLIILEVSASSVKHD